MTTSVVHVEHTYISLYWLKLWALCNASHDDNLWGSCGTCIYKLLLIETSSIVWSHLLIRCKVLRNKPSHVINICLKKRNASRQAFIMQHAKGAKCLGPTLKFMNLCYNLLYIYKNYPIFWVGFGVTILFILVRAMWLCEPFRNGLSCHFNSRKCYFFSYFSFLYKS